MSPIGKDVPDLEDPPHSAPQPKKGAQHEARQPITKATSHDQITSQTHAQKLSPAPSSSLIPIPHNSTPPRPIPPPPTLDTTQSSQSLDFLARPPSESLPEDSCQHTADTTLASFSQTGPGTIALSTPPQTPHNRFNMSRRPELDIFVPARNHPSWSLRTSGILGRLGATEGRLHVTKHR